MLVACPGSPGSTPSTAVRISPSISLLLSTRRFPFICALSFTSSHFTLRPPPLFFISCAACLCYSHGYMHTANTFAFSLDFQLVCIIVAVYNKTVNPSPPPPLFFLPPFPNSGSNSCQLLSGFFAGY